MNYEFLFRICICLLLSFLIGIERQYRRRIIGLRTSILVAIGSFMFVTFSFSIGATDISRVASQVVTGMGFLGAGVILKDGKKVRGLTTAATIWCCAAIGVLTAGGAIFESIIGTIIILFSNIVLRYINKLVNNISGSKDIQIEYKISIISSNKNIDNIKLELDNFFKDNYIDINSLNITKELMDTNLNYSILLKKDCINNIDNIEKIIIDNKIKSFSINKIGEIKIDEFED